MAGGYGIFGRASMADVIWGNRMGFGGLRRVCGEGLGEGFTT